MNPKNNIVLFFTFFDYDVFIFIQSIFFMNPVPMLTFQCFKMVRSREKEWLMHQGVHAQTHPIPAGEKEGFLKRKLIEESQEVSTSETHVHALSELIDVQEAVWALLHHWGISKEGWETLCQEKREARGQYSDGVLLTRLDLPASHSKALHYQSQSERYFPVL
jgi:predicted house-cleaning noncanonical NTP pyrophosphatase (MazG superfamily)